MSAVRALKAARDAGVSLSVDGGDLVLDAFAPPPGAVLDLLSRHKVEIVTLLRSANREWTAEDWQAFFHERTGIAEHDGGMSRSEAEGQALEACIVEWLDGHPQASKPGRCAWCGGAEVSGCTVVPYGTQHHTWLHPECWAPWYQKRYRQAEAALKALGITAPAEFPHDFGKSGRA